VMIVMMYTSILIMTIMIIAMIIYFYDCQ
jgi:hypothetical protein